MKLTSILILCAFFTFSACQEKTSGEYVCEPCDLPCDTLTFTEAGICPHCSMKLVKKSELVNESELQVNEIDIRIGSGVFLIEGGEGRVEKHIKVYYHKPQNYSRESRVLIVIPGAGRNGDSYRDAWVEESEKYGVLILSPMYSEEDYLFEDYHLCGLMATSNLRESVEFIENTNIAQLDEEAFKFEVNTNSADWIFNDFDRLFDLAIKSLGSTQTQYDLFGHSAGGQILHRFAIFHPTSKADQIIAANSGFYTLPDFETQLPFGLKSTSMDKKRLRLSFSNKLTLLIGELDNADEQGGTLLRSVSVDRQGLHRLERGKYFYDFSKTQAIALGMDYRWALKIMPRVGHDHEQMGNAAAELLYESRY